MNTIMAVLGAIAAVIATIGFILFGKPKQQSSGDRTVVEQVQPIPTSQPTPEREIPAASGSTFEETSIATDLSTEEAATEFSQQAIETVEGTEAEMPVGESAEEIPTAGLTLDQVEQPDSLESDFDPSLIASDPSLGNGDGNGSTAETGIEEISASSEEPIEVNFDDATPAEAIGNPAEAEIAAGFSSDSELELDDTAAIASFNVTELGEPLTFRRSDAVPAMAVASYSTTNAPIQHAPFSVLQDSKRPKKLETQKLSQQLLTWGASPKNASQVITYSKDPDPVIRQYVAQALGMMLKQVSDRNELPTVRQALEQLCEDKDATVKAIAESSLGSVKA